MIVRGAATEAAIEAAADVLAAAVGVAGAVDGREAAVEIEAAAVVPVAAVAGGGTRAFCHGSARIFTDRREGPQRKLRPFSLSANYGSGERLGEPTNVKIPTLFSQGARKEGWGTRSQSPILIIF